MLIWVIFIKGISFYDFQHQISQLHLIGKFPNPVWGTTLTLLPNSSFGPWPKSQPCQRTRPEKVAFLDFHGFSHVFFLWNAHCAVLLHAGREDGNLALNSSDLDIFFNGHGAEWSKPFLHCQLGNSIESWIPKSQRICLDPMDFRAIFYFCSSWPRQKKGKWQKLRNATYRSLWNGELYGYEP